MTGNAVILRMLCISSGCSIRWFLDNLDAYLYIRQVRDSGLIAEEIVRESEEYFDYYFTFIQKGLAEGKIKPYPVELIGGMLYQDIVAVMDLIRAQSDPERIEEYISTGFDIFWNGIKAGE